MENEAVVRRGSDKAVIPGLFMLAIVLALAGWWGSRVLGSLLTCCDPIGHGHFWGAVIAIVAGIVLLGWSGQIANANVQKRVKYRLLAEVWGVGGSLATVVTVARLVLR